jgi:hypothetical protein
MNGWMENLIKGLLNAVQKYMPKKTLIPISKPEKPEGKVPPTAAPSPWHAHSYE